MTNNKRDLRQDQQIHSYLPTNLWYCIGTVGAGSYLYGHIYTDDIINDKITLSITFTFDSKNDTLKSYKTSWLPKII